MIPTYQDCLSFVNSNAKNIFWRRRFDIDGYNIYIFGYRFAEYQNFIKPLPDSDINALEMKGISFLQNGDNYDHSLMFNKFWELDQYEHCKYEKFKDLKIKRVMTKEDGNLITFIRLPNGKIISKVKKGFDTMFNRTANNIYKKNEKIRNFVIYCLDNNIIPLFEIVSKKHILVLEYKKEELILLNLRNNLTGEYLDYKNIDYNLEGIHIVKEYDYTLDDLLEIREDLTFSEGWVVQFENDIFLKVKTKWYVEEKSKIYNNIYNKKDS